jgi:hypothetical protein
MNRLVGFVIRVLKEVPLPTGMLDVFFQKYLIMCLCLQNQVYIHKIPSLYNSFKPEIKNWLRFDTMYAVLPYVSLLTGFKL